MSNSIESEAPEHLTHQVKKVVNRRVSLLGNIERKKGGKRVGEGMPDKLRQDLALIEALVLAKKENDQARIETIFGELVSVYQERVWRVIYRYVRDAGDAEDLSQEVFVKVFKKVETFKGTSSFYTWLFRVAINTANDFLDKKKRRPSSFFQDIGGREGGDRFEGQLSYDNRVGRKEPEPSRQIEKRETGDIVREILDELPEPFKTTLFLREFDSLSYQEIALVMDCSIGTVESRLFRARQKFKGALAERGLEHLGRESGL